MASPDIKITITADDRTSGGLASVEANLDGIGNKGTAAAAGIGTFAGAMVAQAIPAAIDFGKELFSLGQASDTMAKKADKVFGAESVDIKAWADDVNESMGLSDEAVVGLAANMGDLLIPMGFARDEAAEMTKTNLGAAAALSAWSGGQYDAAEVADIMTKAMLGEREQLKALGISISAAEVDQRALTLAQADGRDEITAQDKALATQALIMEKSADAQTAWADGTMDAQKAQNELAAAVADVKEDMAKGLVPVVRAVIRFLTEKLIPAIKRTVGWFKDNWKPVIGALAGAFIALIPVLISSAAAAWATAAPIIAIYAPVVALVAALAALGAGAVWLYNNWEPFRKAVDATVSFLRDTAWPIIQETARILWEVLGKAFEVVKETISTAMDFIKKVIETVMAAINGDWDKVWTNIIKFLADANEKIRTMIKAAWDLAKKAVVAAIKAIIEFVKGLPEKAKNALATIGTVLITKGKQLIGGLWSGIKIIWANLLEWQKKLPGKLKDALGTAGTKLVVWGKNIIIGLKNGMINRLNNAREWMKELPGKLKSALGDLSRILWGIGSSIINGLWDGMKSKWNSVAGWLGGLGSKIIGLKGPPETDKVLLTGNGGLIMKGLLTGMETGWRDVERFLSGRTSEIGRYDGSLGIAGGGGAVVGGGTSTVIQNFPEGVRPIDVVRAQQQDARRNGPR